jgi:hypothetical protein
VLLKTMFYEFKSKKAKFSLRAKITALHCQLPFESKGVGIKSVVLQGVDTSLNAKRTKKSKYYFWENGMNSKPDTVKQTT